jgi:regulator of sigma E protease
VEGEAHMDPSPAIGSVAQDYPAQEAGITPGSRVLSVEGEPVATWIEFRDAVHGRPGEEVDLRWVTAEGDTLAAAVTTRVETVTDEEGSREVGMVGVGPRVQREPVGPLRAVQLGAETTVEIIGLSLKSLGMLVTGKASVKDLTGPAGIVYLSGETARAGWITFLSFIALISVSIGLLNILPFPVLDGGHVVYILIEAVIRRPIAPRVKLALQQVGMILLLLLVVIVTYHDILRFFLPE